MGDCGFAVAVRRVISWSRKVETPVAWEWTATRLHLLGLMVVSGTSFVFLRGMSQQSQVFIMAVPTLLVSLPFGKVAMVMADWKQIKSSKLFAMYIGATALVALGWLLCPYLALAVSVASAMLHFGINDTKGRAGNLPGVDLITRGGMLALAVKCQPDAAAWIMRQLVPGPLDGPMRACQLSAVHDVLNQFWAKNRSRTVTVLMVAVLCITVFVQSSQRVALTGANYSADGGLCKAVLILLSIISTPHMMLMSFGLDKTEASSAASLERSLV